MSFKSLVTKLQIFMLLMFSKQINDIRQEMNQMNSTTLVFIPEVHILWVLYAIIKCAFIFVIIEHIPSNMR